MTLYRKSIKIGDERGRAYLENLISRHYSLTMVIQTALAFILEATLPIKPTAPHPHRRDRVNDDHAISSRYRHDSTCCMSVKPVLVNGSHGGFTISFIMFLLLATFQGIKRPSTIFNLANHKVIRADIAFVLIVFFIKIIDQSTSSTSF